MAKPDFGGARGSSAGDDFHEWWALRHALPLLTGMNDLVALTVEGLLAVDETGAPADAWLGVDCAQYFGGSQLSKATKVVVEQLKYSSANPDSPWTLARLQATTNAKKSNSVIARLASAYVELADKRPDLVASNSISIRLVSNQPIAPEVADAMADSKGQKYSALKKAAKLKPAQFSSFLLAVDFSMCGAESRFAHEEACVAEIANVVANGALSLASELKARVHKLMLPEGRGSVISKETILSWLGVAHPDALFPCPPQIRHIEAAVPRQAAVDVLDEMISGSQKLCLHGPGGSGKTTTIQQIQQRLPQGSTMVIFDCYGAGRYQEPDAYRHRAKDAYLQIINELASKLQTPLFINRTGTDDYVREFKQRLELAATTVAARDTGALLVIVVDAADNSVEGARQCAPPEVSFVHEFMKIGGLPANVRVLVTARSSRLADLAMPDSFIQKDISAFTLDETTQFSLARFRTATDQWIQDFHHFSHGIPRVQDYAFQYAATQPQNALGFLLPNGKGLDDIFRERLREALLRDGNPKLLGNLCAALIGLPRPIPVHDLACVIGINEERLFDICGEMSPGIRLVNDAVTFADEDFESFVRDEGREQLHSTILEIAKHVKAEHEVNPYAATHLAGALFAADRGAEIVELIGSGVEPIAIADMVLRREAHHSRLRIAMKVCRASGDAANALLILLIGAEALKIDKAVQETLTDHPDLAATFARQTVDRTILYESSQQVHHGPALMHLLAVDSRKGDGISVREKRRQLREWHLRRTEDSREQSNQGLHPHAWEIEGRDIAAVAEGILRTDGPTAAIQFTLSWTPRLVGFEVAFVLSRQLIARGDTSLLERCVADSAMPKSWQCLLLVPLVLSGRVVDIDALALSLSSRAVTVAIGSESTVYSAFDKPGRSLAELVLTGCEIVVARSKNVAPIVRILERFLKDELRDPSRSYQLERPQGDLALRAFALCECLNGRVATVDSYLIATEVDTSLTEKEKNRAANLVRENHDKSTALIKDRLAIYNARARALLGLFPATELTSNLVPLISRFVGESWRRRSYEHAGMAVQVAYSMSALRCLTEAAPVDAMLLVKTVFKNWDAPFSQNFEALMTELSLSHALHDPIIEKINSWASAAAVAKTASSEKISFLMGLARVLGSISSDDGQAIFNIALKVADEVDGDAMHEIAVLEPLAKRGVSAMDEVLRRKLATRVHFVVDEVHQRLLGYNHFPWTSVARTLSTLSTPLALAAVGCWDDEAVVDQNILLPEVIKAALQSGDITAAQAMALTNLDDTCDAPTLELISSRAQAVIRTSLSEEIARSELLRFAENGRPSTVAVVDSLLNGGKKGPWASRLAEVNDFTSAFDKKAAIPDSSSWKEATAQRVIAFESLLSFAECASLTDSAAIDAFIDATKLKADSLGVQFSASTLLTAMARQVPRADRLAFLKALSNLQSEEVSTYDWRAAVLGNLKSWLPTSLAIQGWFRTEFKQLVVSEFHVFGRYLSEDGSDFEWILQTLALSDAEVTELLLAGIENNSDSLSPQGIYSFIGYAAKFVKPTEAAQVFDRFTLRLQGRFLDTTEVRSERVDDEPVDTPEAVARLLYGFLGDIDLRMRWRAAHSIRCLARLRDSDTLGHVVNRYDKNIEPHFKDPKAPFYWCAARMWLILTLERISSETPDQVVPHAKWLLGVATDDAFPHLLLRMSAKNALNNIACIEPGRLTKAELEQVQDIGQSIFARVAEPNQKVARARDQPEGKHKFRFDPMDTIPYWFTRGVEVFSGLSMKTFQHEAARWIVDMWHVQTDAEGSVGEPRQDRFRNSNYSLSDNRHGSLPTVERYRSHLEWHAMWCAAGSLMKQYPLIACNDDTWGTLEGWLDRNSIEKPEQWLSDIRQCKPLKRQLWAPPLDWLNEPSEGFDDKDFLEVLNLSSDASIAVDVRFSIHTQKTNFTARLSSALVSPVTASALVRALQTADDSWDYHIPEAGHDLEIHETRYCLKGWLDALEGDLRLDECDSFRNDIRRIECVPAKSVFPGLRQIVSSLSQPIWLNAEKRELFSYQTWGDTPSDKRERHQYYSSDLRSDGWQLSMDRVSLASFLVQSDMDLIVQIEIEHEKSKDDTYRYDENTEEKTRFTKILVLRQCGRIESADQHLGSWITSDR